MNTRALILAGVVALVGVGGFLLLQTTTVTETGVHVGHVPIAAASCNDTDCMPELGGKLVTGGELKPEDLRGKTVLVNFWATWCHPCVQEMPALEQTWQGRKDKGLVIVGIAVDGTDESVRKFAAERGVSYPILRSNASIERAFGRPEFLPTSFLYGKDGHLKDKWSRGVDASELAAKLSPVM
jgi:peroxiredoxin